MPTIPVAPDAPGSVAPQAMPSEANLLMALADMHKQGRVPTSQPKADNVVKLGRRPKA